MNSICCTSQKNLASVCLTIDSVHASVFCLCVTDVGVVVTNLKGLVQNNM